MHILLIHQIFVTPDEGGGTRHYELAQYLVNKGHKLTVIASNIDYLTEKKKGKNKETRDGINIIYSHTYQAIHKSFIFRALSFISFAISSFIDAIKVKDVDIVWGTSPPFFQAITSFLVSKWFRKPFVFELRDLWVDFAEELGIVKNRFMIKFMKFLEKQMYRFSHKIIVNSPGYIPFVKKYIGNDNISLIPNGVISKAFEIKNGTILNFRTTYGLNSKFIAIYLGKIGVANDIETIIDAAEQMRDYREILFILMGGGIKKESFQDYIHQHNLSNILLLDSRPKSKIPEVLADVDVCIATLKDIPLFNTTYPNKVFDYMAAGKPTILAIDGVIREVIKSSNGGTYVPPGDSIKLADAMLTYYENPELVKQHGKNAREYVKKYFEREKIADNLEKVFLSLIGRR